MVLEDVIVSETNDKLVGIISYSQAKVQSCAVLFINAGLLHHVGPNRLYVNVSRQLSQHGYLCCRFDCAGIGDSPYSHQSKSRYQLAIDNVNQMMRTIEQQYKIDRFILVGFCAGAAISLRAALVNPNIIGVTSVNIPSEASKRFYLRSYLFNKKKWKKIFSNTINYSAIFNKIIKKAHKDSANREQEEPIYSHESYTDVDNEYHTITSGEMSDLLKKNIKILWVLSQWDPALDYSYYLLRPFSNSIQKENLSIVTLRETDHSLYPLAVQQRLITACVEWVCSITMPREYNFSHGGLKELGFIKNAFH